jgi:hypothetical protein
MLRIFSPHSLMTKKPGADFQRDEGRGTRDGMSWEGEAPAEPKTAAIGDWRLATTASEVVKCRKFFGSAGALPSRKTIRHSLLTIRHSPFATRHSLFATHYSLLAAVSHRPSPFLRFTVSPFLASLAAHFYSFPASPFPAFCFAAMMSARA